MRGVPILRILISILRFILGSTYFGKLPHPYPNLKCSQNVLKSPSKRRFFRTSCFRGSLSPPWFPSITALSVTFQGNLTWLRTLHDLFSFDGKGKSSTGKLPSNKAAREPLQ